MKRSGIMRTLALLATIVVAAAACSASTATKGPATGPFKIGYSNGGGVGNGFREEQVCTAKAQAKADKANPEAKADKASSEADAGKASTGARGGKRKG